MENLFYNEKEVTLNVLTYRHNPLAVGIVLWDASMDNIITSVTTNLGTDIGNGTILPRYCSFVDINNNGDEIMDFLEENGIAEPYVRFGEPVEMQAEFVSYPLYRFNEHLLKEYDPEGCKKFEKGYEKGFYDVMQPFK